MPHLRTLMLIAPVSAFVMGCTTEVVDRTGLCTGELPRRADVAAQALLDPRVPDRTVIAVEPFVTGYRAGCGQYKEKTSWIQRSR